MLQSLLRNHRRLALAISPLYRARLQLLQSELAEKPIQPTLERAEDPVVVSFSIITKKTTFWKKRFRRNVLSWREIEGCLPFVDALVEMQWDRETSPLKDLSWSTLVH